MKRHQPLSGTDDYYFYAFFKLNRSSKLHMVAVREPLEIGLLAEAIASVLVDQKLTKKGPPNV